MAGAFVFVCFPSEEPWLIILLKSDVPLAHSCLGTVGLMSGEA